MHDILASLEETIFKGVDTIITKLPLFMSKVKIVSVNEILHHEDTSLCSVKHNTIKMYGRIEV
jgi:putative NIF3 family GTP cyclohydrolase 1 type 2